MGKLVGILGLQGDFALHQECLKRIGVESKIIRRPEELKSCKGLILPGGESSTFIKLLKETGLFEGIKKFAMENKQKLLRGVQPRGAGNLFARPGYIAMFGALSPIDKSFVGSRGAHHGWVLLTFMAYCDICGNVSHRQKFLEVQEPFYKKVLGRRRQKGIFMVGEKCANTQRFAIYPPLTNGYFLRQ